GYRHRRTYPDANRAPGRNRGYAGSVDQHDALAVDCLGDGAGFVTACQGRGRRHPMVWWHARLRGIEERAGANYCGRRIGGPLQSVATCGPLSPASAVSARQQRVFDSPVATRFVARCSGSIRTWNFSSFSPSDRMTVETCAKGNFTGILLVVIVPDRLSGDVRSRRFPPFRLRRRRESSTLCTQG